MVLLIAWLSLVIYSAIIQTRTELEIKGGRVVGRLGVWILKAFKVVLLWATFDFSSENVTFELIEADGPLWFLKTDHNLQLEETLSESKYYIIIFSVCSRATGYSSTELWMFHLSLNSYKLSRSVSVRRFGFTQAHEIIYIYIYIYMYKEEGWRPKRQLICCGFEGFRELWCNNNSFCNLHVFFSRRS